MTTSDWIFRSLAVLLAVLACGAFVFGLWGDLLRGRTKRPRCPKCWYDLQDTTPESDGKTLCSECGSRSADRMLHRARRQWWMVILAAVVFSIGLALWFVPAVKRHGWQSAVPTWVIVHFWSLDEVAWMENGASTPMLAELERRIAENSVSNDMLEAWSIRIAGAYARESGSTGSVARSFYPGTTCAVLDFGPILKSAHPESFAAGFDIGRGQDWEYPKMNAPFRPSGMSMPQADLADESESLRSVLCQVVVPDGWADNGGSEAIVRTLGTRFLVLAPTETVELCRKVLASFEQVKQEKGMAAEHEVVHIDSPDGTIIATYSVSDIPSHRAGSDMWASERVNSVWSRLLDNVDTDLWTDNGGSDASAFQYPPFLIVRASPEIQAKVAEYIYQLRAGENP